MNGRTALLVAAPLFALTFIPSQIALHDLTPIGLITLRFTISVLALAPLAVRNRRAEPGPIWRASLLAGMCGLGVFLCQMGGLPYTTTANSAFISSLPVIVVPILMALWLRRLPGWPVGLGVLLALAGTFLLTGAHLPLNRGDSITLGVALFGACNIIVIGLFAARVEPIAFAALQMAVVAIGGAVLLPIAGFGTLTWAALAGALVAGLAQSGGLALQVIGQSTVPPTLATLILNAMPMWATLLALLTGERFGALAAAGAALILAAIGVSQLRARSTLDGARDPAEPEPAVA
ncbi:MAG: DMT family transporter [Chloroflexi bacterium]|nr:DMT family transporter [Chloroflexota bacterium]